MVSSKKAVAGFIVILFTVSFSWSALPSLAQGKEETAKPPTLDAKMRTEVVKERNSG